MTCNLHMFQNELLVSLCQPVIAWKHDPAILMILSLINTSKKSTKCDAPCLAEKLRTPSPGHGTWRVCPRSVRLSCSWQRLYSSFQQSQTPSFECQTCLGLFIVSLCSVLSHFNPFQWKLQDRKTSFAFRLPPKPELTWAIGSASTSADRIAHQSSFYLFYCHRSVFLFFLSDFTAHVVLDPRFEPSLGILLCWPEQPKGRLCAASSWQLRYFVTSKSRPKLRLRGGCRPAEPFDSDWRSARGACKWGWSESNLFLEPFARSFFFD